MLAVSAKGAAKSKAKASRMSKKRKVQQRRFDPGCGLKKAQVVEENEKTGCHDDDPGRGDCERLQR